MKIVPCYKTRKIPTSSCDPPHILCGHVDQRQIRQPRRSRYSFGRIPLPDKSLKPVKKLHEQKIIVRRVQRNMVSGIVGGSVADPGCFFRIQTVSNTDPGSPKKQKNGF